MFSSNSVNQPTKSFSNHTQSNSPNAILPNTILDNGLDEFEFSFDFFYEYTWNGCCRY